MLNFIRRSSFLAAAAIVACGGGDSDPTSAKIPGEGIAAIDTAMLMHHIAVLASDSLMGRAPGTPGEEKTSAYVEAQFSGMGLKPGNPDGTYIQKVPLVGITVTNSPTMTFAKGGTRTSLQWRDDFVAWTKHVSPSASLRNSELVFVGYGVEAPEFGWDDFKGVDLKGKTMVVLVNDPPVVDTAVFGGARMTYYGRWTYKFEEAERQGAVGALIVHTTERAGYPWHTVVGSWAKEQRMLPRDPALPKPLGFEGWITDTAAAAMLKQAGLDLDTLCTDAESRAFTPVPTGITLDVSFTNTVQHLESANVIGLVRGRDARLKHEYVMLSAHWDHLGIGPPVNGDSIYNGAEDNASGVADVLAIARVMAQGPKPKRTTVFAFVTAEESGLLGSQYLAENPVVPTEEIVADLNLDGGNVLGRTRDLTVLGDTKSSLGPQLAAAIKPGGMRIAPDDFPERGYFYRSDHFSFAKAGVPSVSIGAGNDFIGRPPGWGVRQDEDYTAHRYHQPSDAYRPDFDLSGAVQLSNVVLAFARQLATEPNWPTWNRDAEFRRPARKKIM